MRHECVVRAEDLGPYLLGQLGPDESARVAEAVESCPSCAADGVRLRPVVAALARGVVPLEDTAPVAPPPALDRVLASVHGARAAHRRRLRNRVALAAAALVLVVGTGLGALAVFDRGDDNAAGREVALRGSVASVGANVVVSERGWGTALTLDVWGLKPGKAYGAWLADRSGNRVPAGTFRPTADGTAHLDLGASLALPQAGAIGVTQLGGDDVLRGTLGASVRRSLGASHRLG